MEGGKGNEGGGRERKRGRVVKSKEGQSWGVKGRKKDGEI